MKKNVKVENFLRLAICLTLVVALLVVAAGCGGGDEEECTDDV